MFQMKRKIQALVLIWWYNEGKGSLPITNLKCFMICACETNVQHYYHVIIINNVFK